MTALAKWMGLVAAMACWPVDGEAHLGDRLYVVHEISDEDLALIDINDGSTEDWQEILSEPTLTSLDFNMVVFGEDTAPYTPDDFDYRVWLGWNRTKGIILCAVEAYDDDYCEYGTDDLFGPSLLREQVNLCVDGDHSGGQYMFGEWNSEEHKLNDNRTAQYYRAVPTNPDGHRLAYYGAGDDWVTYPPYADVGGNALELTPGAHWVVEFYVTAFDDLIWDLPDDSRRSELSVGKIIGMELNVFDQDSDAGWDGTTIARLSPTELTYSDADLFVDAVLVGAGGEGTSVGSVTWGRIKASFR